MKEKGTDRKRIYQDRWAARRSYLASLVPVLSTDLSLFCSDHYDQVVNWTQGLNQEVSWPALQHHLKATDKKAFEALSRIEYIETTSSRDNRVAKRAGGFAYEFWCQGGDINNVDHLLGCFSATLENNDDMTSEDKSMERAKERVQLAISRNAKRAANAVTGNDIWALPLKERRLLLQKWKQEMNPWTVVDQTAEVYRRHLMAVAQTIRNRDEIYLKCLAERRSS